MKIVAMLILLVLCVGCTNYFVDEKSLIIENDSIKDLTIVSNPDIDTLDTNKIIINTLKEEPSVIITKPDKIIPSVEIMNNDLTNDDENKIYIINDADLEQLSNIKLAEHRSELSNGFQKLKIGETYGFGLKIKNIYHSMPYALRLTPFYFLLARFPPLSFQSTPRLLLYYSYKIPRPAPA